MPRALAVALAWLPAGLTAGGWALATLVHGLFGCPGGLKEVEACRAAVAGVSFVPLMGYGFWWGQLLTPVGVPATAALLWRLRVRRRSARPARL